MVMPFAPRCRGHRDLIATTRQSHATALPVCACPVQFVGMHDPGLKIGHLVVEPGSANRSITMPDRWRMSASMSFREPAAAALQMSFAQQVDKFRQARLVVGEDSSALHILWSDAADLVVIAPFGKMNFYHIGIQSLNGGRMAILWGDNADPTTGHFRVDIDRLCRTITALIQ